MLECEDRLWIKEVRFSLSPPLIFTADGKFLAAGNLATRRVGDVVTCNRLCCDHIDIDPAKSRGATDEVLIDEGSCEADRLEDLCAGIGGDGRDTHLRHHLQDSLAERLDQVAYCFLWADTSHDSTEDEILNTLHREIRIDGCRTKADE